MRHLPKLWSKQMVETAMVSDRAILVETAAKPVFVYKLSPRAVRYET